MVHIETPVYPIHGGDVNGWIRPGVCCVLAALERPMLICYVRLGDRHGENLLFEEGTGGILHVDFNCLFDKVNTTWISSAALQDCLLFHRAKLWRNLKWFHSVSRTT